MYTEARFEETIGRMKRPKNRSDDTAQAARHLRHMMQAERECWGEMEMGIVISDEIVHATGLSEAELRLEIAALLFQKEKLSIGQASRLAGMSRLQFQHALASRQIPVHYDVAEFEADLQTLHDLDQP